MDKKIREIEKKVSKNSKGEEKSLKSLEKSDKKRDKFVDAGKKEMAKKKKKWGIYEVFSIYHNDNHNDSLPSWEANEWYRRAYGDGNW